MNNLTKIINRSVCYNVLSNIKYSDIECNIVNNFDKENTIKDEEETVIDYVEGISFKKDIKYVEEIDFNNI